jgi:hypothetical protein
MGASPVSGVGVEGLQAARVIIKAPAPRAGSRYFVSMGVFSVKVKGYKCSLDYKTI